LRLVVVDLFLDRDGTLIRDVGYIAHPEQIEFLSGAISGLREFNKMKFRLHLVSNQSGVGRGIISIDQFLKVEHEFESILKINSIVLHSTNFCFHTPTDYCECRKPKTGLLTAIESKFDMKKKFTGMIGNSESDLETARNFGIHYWNIDEKAEDSFLQQSRLVRHHFERIRASIE
jgi:D-glycero-D-manno-heptose 1,7-bisphosphate phosphatase